jgi:hypothetical protein
MALAASYVFLSTYVPAVVFPIRRPGLPRLLAALPAIALCLYVPALVPWVSGSTVWKRAGGVSPGIRGPITCNARPAQGIPRVVAGCITMWLSTFKVRGAPTPSPAGRSARTSARVAPSRASGRAAPRPLGREAGGVPVRRGGRDRALHRGAGRRAPTPRRTGDPTPPPLDPPPTAAVCLCLQPRAHGPAGPDAPPAHAAVPAAHPPALAAMGCAHPERARAASGAPAGPKRDAAQPPQHDAHATLTKNTRTHTLTQHNDARTRAQASRPRWRGCAWCCWARWRCRRWWRCS